MTVAVQPEKTRICSTPNMTFGLTCSDVGHWFWQTCPGPPALEEQEGTLLRTLQTYFPIEPYMRTREASHTEFVFP